MPPDVDKYHAQTILLTAYLQTNYVVRAGALEIKIHIGQHPNGLTPLVTTLNPFNSWAIITACNPTSMVCSNRVNQQQSLEMKRRIEALHCSYLPSCALAKNSNFPPEAGFFIQNIQSKDLHKLAVDFGQNAVVVGDLSSVAKLLIIPEVWKTRPSAIDLPPFVDILSPAIENTALVSAGKTV